MIKFLLVASVLLLGLSLLRGAPSARHLALRRLISLMVMAAGVTAILFPDLVTAVAKLVGVGRGTDLVLYVFVLAFLFVTLAMYQRMSRLEDRCVTLARRLAIVDAQRRLGDERVG